MDLVEAIGPTLLSEEKCSEWLSEGEQHLGKPRGCDPWGKGVGK
jgi:hypothetical protein